ncbi:MAG: hypothetical protein J0M04_00070 [Verrucomicrobia bacterium]|nr:hypothetical protein [Verrucomicrobiota bacterium]
MKHPSDSVREAITALTKFNWTQAAGMAQSAIDGAKSAAQHVDPRLYMVQGVASFREGSVTHAVECFRYILKNKRTILKWGFRGIKVISLVLSIIALPDRADKAIAMIGDILRDEIA